MVQFKARKPRALGVKRSRIRFALAAGLLLLLGYVLYGVVRPRSDEDRYTEYLGLRRSFHQAASSRSGLVDRVGAATHGSKPLDYFRRRCEDRRQELLRSGYFVQVTVPVSNLNSKVIPITASLENTARRTGFYYEVLMGFSLNEVRLVCRKQDVPVWEEAIQAGARR